MFRLVVLLVAAVVCWPLLAAALVVYGGYRFVTR